MERSIGVEDFKKIIECYKEFQDFLASLPPHSNFVLALQYIQNGVLWAQEGMRFLHFQQQIKLQEEAKNKIHVVPNPPEVSEGNKSCLEVEPNVKGDFCCAAQSQN